MLAAGGTRRASATPNVPSLAEAAGVREIDTDIWYGLYAPARTPKDIIAKLNREMNTLLRVPDVADTLWQSRDCSPPEGLPSSWPR